MPIASHFPSVSFHRARRGIAVLVLAAVSPALSWAAPADPAAPVAAATAPSAAGSVAVPVAAVSKVPAPTFDAKAWIALDANCGQICGAVDPGQTIEPESMTKPMSANNTK